MKQGLIQEIDWSHIGALLARDDDNAQSAFFKAFVKEARTYDTNHQTERQMIAISEKLTDEEKEVLSAITYREADQ